MNHPTIQSVRGGWDIALNGTKMAFIEAGSFYLKAVRFSPAGEILIHSHNLAFSMVSNEVYPYLWGDAFSVEVNGATWLLKARHRAGTLENVTRLEAIADAGGGLKYVIRQDLHVLADHELVTERVAVDGREYLRLEVTDPYYQHIVGPAFDFDGYWPGIFNPGLECHTRDWRKRWQMFVTENPRGTFVGRRHNHHYPDWDWTIARGGILAAMDDPAGNPAYRFLSGAADVGFCWWGYDTHFNLLLEPGEIIDKKRGRTVLRKGAAYALEYELFCLGPEESRRIAERLVLPEPDPLALAKMARPVITPGVNRFDRALELADMQSFAWEPSDTGASWDHTQGHDDTHSLKLSGDGSGAIPSWSTRVGQEMFMPPITGGKPYRLSVMVKTRAVRGEGVKAGVSYGVPRWPGMHGELLPCETCWTRAVKSDNDWTRIEVVTPPAPQGAISAFISMELHGSGEAWMDSLLFEAI